VNLKAHWISRGRSAQNEPDPAFPDGIEVDMSRGLKHCALKLDYPAPHVGSWLVTCAKCEQRILVTAAGRRDDPRLIKLACKRRC
jgi:hypothetical protein